MADCADILKDEPPLDIFFIRGVGTTIVSVIGILGNVLTTLVLTRPQMKSSTTTLLLGLSVCDLLYVTTTCISIGSPALFTYLKVWREYITTVLPVIYGPIFAIRSFSLVGSAYITVAVSVERFIVVHFPLRARTYCTVKNAVRTSMVIIGFAVLFTLPTWVGISYEHRYVNGTWVCHRITYPQFRRNPNYQLYYSNWAINFVYRIIPFLLLSVLNWKIYDKVREANVSRQTMTQSESNEVSIAKMLLVVVLVFLACHSVRTIIRLKYNIFEGRVRKIPRVYESIGDFFINLNSAVNFIIYCLMSEKFRRTCHFLCPRSMRGTDADGSTSTSSTNITSSIDIGN